MSGYRIRLNGDDDRLARCRAELESARKDAGMLRDMVLVSWALFAAAAFVAVLLWWLTR